MSSELIDALSALRNEVQSRASHARKTDSGTGSWWELSGYAEVLADAMIRIDRHRRRSEGIDRQIQRAAGNS